MPVQGDALILEVIVDTDDYTVSGSTFDGWSREVSYNER